jgi:S-DNA-T family DNA segregation ATPase FtsK/SpoIIIE
MIDEIINKPQKAIAILQWACNEMEKRYTTFKENEVRDIDEYNETIASDTVAKIPKLVIIVDEVSDLMQYAKRELEARILSLSQKARAAGIHLVLATQRPSVDVITGVIKTNLPSRIAFRVGSAVDSGTILSEGGAEKLLGNGDMLYRNSVMPKCVRYQGAFISMSEVKAIVKYIKENNVAYFDDKAADEIEKTLNPPAPETETADGDGAEEGAGGEDKLFIDALRLVISTGSASISMLQRRFPIGYAKAGGIIDKMDRMGYISPFDGSRARQVLITKEQFEEKYGEF